MTTKRLKEVAFVISFDFIEAHKFCSNHRKSICNDIICGCFYCLKIYNPIIITDWVGDISGTALCPYCGIDSVIGQSSGYPITEEFLTKMQGYWF